MIVAYDLRYACDHFAGIGKHAHALLEALLDLPGDDRYLVLWDPRQRNTRFDFTALRAHPRVEWVERPWHPIRPLGMLQTGLWLRQRRPDVYLSPFGLRPLFSGVREVLTLHDVSALRMAHIPSFVSRVLYRLSLLDAVRATRILTDSTFSRDEIVELLPVRADRVRPVLLGVPTAPTGAPVVPQRPAGLVAERFALVVADNRPRKNLAVLARAWADDAPELTLAAVGPRDPRFPSLEEAAGGSDRVVSLGWVTPAELAWLYAHAELVLLPSRYEGFGFPLLEAMTAGVPAVVSDIPVFHEVGGEAARYVPVDDPAAWRAAVRTLAADPAARAALRQAGLARAATFTYRRTAEETLAVLRDAVR